MMKSESRSPKDEGARDLSRRTAEARVGWDAIERTFSFGRSCGLKSALRSVGLIGLVLLLSLPSTLNSQPSPNRVLDLDGTEGHVRLPGFVFTNLSQAT